MSFQERLMECIKNSGKTQVNIAQEANISKQCISDYKAGKSTPSIDTLRLLCKSLDVSADYLLELSDDY